MRRAPIAGPPITRANTPAKPWRSRTESAIFWVAMAVRGVSSEGFQTTVSPQAAATSAFHDHTATGKLKALITPMGPRGCHCSYMRWPGRSECMDRP